MISYVISHYHHEGWTYGFVQVVETAVHVDTYYIMSYCVLLYDIAMI
jgi:hypothetical protein